MENKKYKEIVKELLIWAFQEELKGNQDKATKIYNITNKYKYK